MTYKCPMSTLGVASFCEGKKDGQSSQHKPILSSLSEWPTFQEGCRVGWLQSAVTMTEKSYTLRNPYETVVDKPSLPFLTDKYVIHPVMATWIIRSETNPSRRRKISFPSLQTQEGWCTIGSRHQQTHVRITLFSHDGEDLLWVMFFPLSCG